jgi:hypothetical protein
MEKLPLAQGAHGAPIGVMAFFDVVMEILGRRDWAAAYLKRSWKSNFCQIA